jgi:hypothetical protein
MADLDLSIWVGRPPSRSRVDVGLEEEDASLEDKLASKPPRPGDFLPAETSASPREDDRDFSEPSTRSSSSDVSFDNGFYIDVPRLHDSKDYEHLPGYFTVIRAIREVNPGHYLVKLKSGEFDQVSKPFP